MDERDTEHFVTHADLVAAAEAGISALAAEQAACKAMIATLEAKQRSLGQHPNHTAYVHGGLVASEDFRAGHILPLAGFCRTNWREAIDRLDAVSMPADAPEACTLVRLRIACEQDQSLEAAGFAWLGDTGLLKQGRVDPYWIQRPKLGLGQPAIRHGLRLEDHYGHRGLYTLAPVDLRHLFAQAAQERGDLTFGDLLRLAIDLGGAALAARGAAVIRHIAKLRYEDDCRRFAEHQRTNGDRRWRWKPPLSRQGHLAVTTARIRDVAMPTNQTRGHAANWLDDHGANPRFRED